MKSLVISSKDLGELVFSFQSSSNIPQLVTSFSEVMSFDPELSLLKFNFSDYDMLEEYEGLH